MTHPMTALILIIFSSLMRSLPYNHHQIGGLIYFNMNDVGICEGIKMLWSL